MKTSKRILFMAVLAAVLVFLLNPGWNPFLEEGVANAVRTQLQSVFGFLAGGEGSGIFSPAKFITAAAVLVFMWLVTMLACLILEKSSAGKRRSETVAGLLASVVKAVGAITTLVWVLSVLGVDLAAIFASLGVVSLILGFGVQSLIEDCVTGIFIILEGEYNIGDIIVLEDFRGTVKHISMRTTVIEDDGGNLKIVNNSDIRNVQNRSRNHSAVTIEVGISYEADLEAVEEVLNQELPLLQDKYPGLFKTVPRYMGVQNLAASAVELRIMSDSEEGSYYRARRVLLRESKLILDRHNISIPYNQLVIHQE